jgi:hypothetical protein
VCEPVGLPVQLAVGQALALVDEGHGVGAARGLLLETLVDESLRGVGAPRLVPGGEQAPLPGRERGQLGEAAVRARREALDERPQVLQHPLDRRAFDPARVERQLEEEGRAGHRLQRERVVRAAGEAVLADLQPAGLLREGTLRGVVLEDDEALEERDAARHLTPALHVDEQAVLEIPRLGLLLLHPPEPRQEALARPDADARRQRVDEEADHLLDAVEVRRAARDGRPEDDILVAAVAAQEQRPRALHERVERQLVLARERRQLGRRPLRQLGPPLVVRLELKRRLARRRDDAERRRAREAFERPPPERLGLRPPVLLLSLEPRDVVAVGARAPEPRVGPAPLRLVEGEDLPEQD